MTAPAPPPAHLVEFLVTVGTLVLLVGVVGLQVPHFGGGVREGAPAVVALVGLLPTVHQLVPLEVTRGGEELPAVVTAVLGLPRVPLLVQVQQADEAVALPTLLTAIGLQRAARHAGLAGEGSSTASPRRPLTPLPPSQLQEPGGSCRRTCASSRGLCTQPGLRRLYCTPCRRRVSLRCGCGCAA